MWYPSPAWTLTYILGKAGENVDIAPICHGEDDEKYCSWVGKMSGIRVALKNLKEAETMVPITFPFSSLVCPLEKSIGSFGKWRTTIPSDQVLTLSITTVQMQYLDL